MAEKPKINRIKAVLAEKDILQKPCCYGGKNAWCYYADL